MSDRTEELWAPLWERLDALKAARRGRDDAAEKGTGVMRQMRDRAAWWGDYAEDIAKLREALNAADIDGTDEQIATAYVDYSDEFWAAGWMQVSIGVRGFVSYVEREWLHDAADEARDA